MIFIVLSNVLLPCLQLSSDWVSDENSIGLSLSEIASNEPSDGLMELRMVIFCSTLKFSTFL